jgi:mycoredoxin
MSAPAWIAAVWRRLSNFYTLHPSQVVIYTSAACGDCRMAKSILHRKNVPYVEISLEGDRRARRFVQRLNQGFASVPTIVFPDGSVLVEPSMPELTARFSDS